MKWYALAALVWGTAITIAVRLLRVAKRPTPRRETQDKLKRRGEGQPYFSGKCKG